MAALRSPHVPSGSLPFPLDKVTPERSRSVFTGSVPRSEALVMRSEWRSFPLARIKFLGERQVIFDPEAAVPAAGQMTERRCSVR